MKKANDKSRRLERPVRTKPSGPVDSGRRRLLAGIAAAGGSLLSSGCQTLPGFGQADVCREIKAEGQRSDRKCVIKKGTLLQPQKIPECRDSMLFYQNPGPCTEIVDP